MVRSLALYLTRDRMLTAAIWIVLLTFAWSLPVASIIVSERERALIESGHYYTPKMPADWYLARE